MKRQPVRLLAGGVKRLGLILGIALTLASPAWGEDGRPTDPPRTSRVARVVLADLVVQQTGPAAAAVGANFTYTIKVDNLGPDPASGVVLTDTLPAGINFVSATGGGTAAAGVVSFPAIPALAPGGSVEYQVTVSAPAPGTYTSIGAATSADPDPDPSSNNGTQPTARVTTVVGGAADIVVTQSGPATAFLGVPFVYTITVTNNGPGVATDVVVSDTGQAGFELVAVPPGGVTTSGATVIFPVIPSLAPGASMSYDLTVRVTAPGTYNVIAAATASSPDPVPANNNGSAANARVTTVVSENADVVTTQSGPTTVLVGVPFVYTITVTNNGPSTATNVVVSDTGQAGFELVAVPPGGVTTVGATVIFATIPSLAPGASVSLPLTVRIIAPGTYTVIAASTSPTPDADPANNNGSLPAARVTTVAVLGADIVATKAGPAFGVAGQDLAYTLTVRNDGPSPAADVVVTDTLPAGMTFVAASAGGTAAAGVVSWPPATFAVGEVRTYSLTARASAPGTYLNLAAATSTTLDPTPANNNGSAAGARVTTVIGALADVSVRKSGPATVAVGSPFVHQIIVTNNGPSAAAAVAVSDTLPTGLVFLSATGGGSASGGVVNWPPIPSLAAGTSATYDVTLLATAGGSFTNVAAATSSTPDPVLANNNGSSGTSRATTVATADADVAVTKTGPAAGAVGATVRYLVTVSNSGPAPATNVVVTDTLPPGATLIAATSGGTVSGGVVTWPAIDTLAAGSTRQFAVELRYLTPGAVVNIAAATAAGPDPNAANNRATAPTLVSGPVAAADLRVTKAGPATATANSDVGYTIEVSNLGPSEANAVVITDTIPAGATFISASGGATVNGRVVTWPTVPTLVNGASLSYSVTVRFAVAGSYTNIAAGRSTTPDPNPSNNNGSDPSARATTVVSLLADVATTKTGPDRVDVGGTINYRIETRNLGPSFAEQVVVTDTLPAGVVVVSTTGGGIVSGRVITWPTIPLLDVGTAVVYNVTATAPFTGGRLTNVVASTSATADPNPGNNNGQSPAARVSTDVTPIDVALFKVHDGTFVPGGIGTYRLTVRNVGSATTVGPIAIVDTLPAGLTLQTATGPGWNCTSSNQVVNCLNPTAPLFPGVATTVTMQVLVSASAPATITNRAGVSTSGDEAYAGNNVATDVVSLAPVTVLAIEKTASVSEAEIGDQVDYTVLIRNLTGAEIPGVRLDDVLPKGFTYQRRTARVGMVPVADPAGAVGPSLGFAIGTLPPNGVVKLTYRIRIGAGAMTGNGINESRARTASGLESNLATAFVRVRGGVFTDRAFITGRVALDAAAGEVGVPGVRIVLEDGTSVVTDRDGRYHLAGLVSGLHVLRVDSLTLPAGSRLVLSANRQAGDATSRFVDLKNGELHRADFLIAGDDAIVRAAERRRALGDVTGPIIDRPFVTADTTDAGVYRPLAGALAANPVDELNRLPMARLPGSTVPVLSVPNGSVDLMVSRTSAPADGQTEITVRVAVLDQDRRPVNATQPLTLETSLGRWLQQDLDPVEPGLQVMLPGGAGTFVLVAPAVAGVGEVRATSGLRVASTVIGFLPVARPLIVNGLVEARVDLRSLVRDGLVQVTAADRFERELRDISTSSDDGKLTAGARAALYLQGKVKGSTLLTLAFDSERDPERRMFRDIQPDEFYPVYGDGSVTEFGAQSFDRLYVRVDSERSFALYGDYVTPGAGTGPLAARELGAYQRSLTGALVHTEGRRGQLNAFASRDRLRQVVDEIPGQGISGPYQLRRTDGRLNSERVELITRDRNQPSRIIATVPQTRFTDYTIEPFTGRLLFFAPVPSVDADLNPVSIRVLYEVESAGPEYWVYGADGQLRFGDDAEIGASIVRDDDPSGGRDLYSANGAVALSRSTVLLAEVARSEGDSAGTSGTATRVELRHQSARVQGSVFSARSDADFTNPSSTFQAGRAELGLRGTALLDDRTALIGEAIRTEDRIGGGHRAGILAGLERRIGRFVRAEFGYRHASETDEPASVGTAVTTGATPNETNALRARLTLQVPGQPRASVFGEFEQDVVETDQRRGAVGGQYVLFDRLRLYGRHEFLGSFAGPFAQNGVQRQASTVFGVDAGYTRDGQIFGEYRARDVFAGREAEAAIGLRNRWNVSRGVSLNAGFERVDVLKGTGQGEATAISTGIEYSGSPDWRGTARFEYRFAPVGDNLLATAGYVRRIGRDWTVLGRGLYNELGDGSTRTRSQLGLAWRQTGNAWNALARWEYRHEDLAPDTDNAVEETKNIVSTHVNYQPHHAVNLSGRFAWQQGTRNAGGLETDADGTLGSVRILYDFLPRWDAGLIGTSFWQGGRQQGLGFELGRTLVTNLRAAVGYNIFGFRDPGLITDGTQTDRGVYLHLGVKFGESLFRGQQD